MVCMQLIGIATITTLANNFSPVDRNNFDTGGGSLKSVRHTGASKFLGGCNEAIEATVVLNST